MAHQGQPRRAGLRSSLAVLAPLAGFGASGGTPFERRRQPFRIARACGGVEVEPSPGIDEMGMEDAQEILEVPPELRPIRRGLPAPGRPLQRRVPVEMADELVALRQDLLPKPLHPRPELAQGDDLLGRLAEVRVIDQEFQREIGLPPALLGIGDLADLENEMLDQQEIEVAEEERRDAVERLPLRGRTVEERAAVVPDAAHGDAMDAEGLDVLLGDGGHVGKLFQ